LHATPSESPEPPVAGWSSPAEQAWHKVILWSSAAGLGFLLLGGAIGFWLSSRSGTSIAPSDSVAAGESKGNAETVDTETAPDEAKQDDRETNEAAAGDSPEKPKATAKEKPAAKENEAGTEEAPNEQDPKEPAEATPKPASKPAEKVAVLDPIPEATEKPQAAPAGDPLDLLPDEALPPLQGPVAEQKQAEQEKDDSPLADPGSKPANEEPLDPEMLSDTPAEKRRPAESPVVRRAPRSEDTPEEIDIKERLAMTLSHFEFREAPLVDVLGAIADVSLLPITFDLPALAEADVDLEASISVHQSDAALATVLSAVLSQQGLTYQVQEDQLLITTTRAVDRSLHTYVFPVDDLVGGEPAAAAELAGRMKELVAPATWEATGGAATIEVESGRLRITQTRPILYRLVIFSEKLRVARGLKPRSRIAPHRFRLTSRTTPAAKELRQKITLTFHTPTRLVEVMQYFETASGMRVLFDWGSLASQGFDPAGRISCAIEDRPLSDALSALLTPLGLAWQVVDKDTIEVFSRSDIPAKMQVEFYPVGPILDSGSSPENLLTELRSGTGPSRWNLEEGGGHIEFDAPSRHLIVRQISPVQAEVESWLEAYRERLALEVP